MRLSRLAWWRVQAHLTVLSMLCIMKSFCQAVYAGLNFDSARDTVCAQQWLDGLVLSCCDGTPASGFRMSAGMSLTDMAHLGASIL